MTEDTKVVKIVPTEEKSINMYDMGLNDWIGYETCEVLRVPGGWIYTTYVYSGSNILASNSMLIKYDEEFKNE